jgi:hypothetical protein
MRRRKNFTLAFVMNCLLVVLLLVSFGSGWAIYLLGLEELGLHRWVSVVFVGGVVVHVLLHHQSLSRRKLRRPRLPR